MKAIGTSIGIFLLLFLPQLIAQGAAAKNSFLSIYAMPTRAKVAQTKPELAQLICPAQLRAEIDAKLDLPKFHRLRWGILVQTLSSSHTLYSRNAQQYFIPASNAKLLTTAAALHKLGSQFRIRTSIYSGAQNSLHVVGRGDPSLSDIQLKQLAQQLSHQGIRQVSQLIAEDNYFRGPLINPSWEWEDLQADYGTSVNSLILNQNAAVLTILPQQLGQKVGISWGDPTEGRRWQIENEALTARQAQPSLINVSRNLHEPILQITGQLGVDSKPEPVALAVLDPAGNFLQHFRNALAAENIAVGQAGVTTSVDLPSLEQRLRTTSTVRELAAVESPPLSQLLIETNQNSNNLYAEALLRTIGAKVDTGATTDSTAEVGLRVVKTTLTQLGVDSSSYILVDGSGLSRQNLVSPEALVQTLRAMAFSPEAAVYRASLPVAGISGTLGNRFRDTAAQGMLQAKTGTMSGIVAISGYLDTSNYEPIVFSMVANQSDQSAPTLRQAIDEVVLLLTQLHPC